MPVTNYPEWELHSRKLSKEEVEDPGQVIHELFDFAHLPDLRQLLWQWLRTTVAGDFNDGLDLLERTEILVLYEKIEKLVEAAHILHIKQQKENQYGLPDDQHPF